MGFRKCVSTRTPYKNDGNLNRKANQKHSGSTRIGNLNWESRTWLVVATKLCVLCQAGIYLYGDLIAKKVDNKS